MSTDDLERFRRNIGRRVLFTSPIEHAGRTRTEQGVITGVDHRMVYVDYGYANPVWPELGHSIATHPANLSWPHRADPRRPGVVGSLAPSVSKRSRPVEGGADDPCIMETRSRTA